MDVQEIQNKINNIEDPELKMIVNDINDFIFPKFQSLQEKLKGVGPLKMLMIIKEFASTLSIEYKDQFGRDFEEDMKKTNDYLGIDQSSMLSMLKNLT